MHLPGRQQCISGNNHQLQNREATFGELLLLSRVSLFKEIFSSPPLSLALFFAGCVSLALSDSCNSTGYPITAVYSRVRLAFHSLDRRSLSVCAADMRLQQPRL